MNTTLRSAVKEFNDLKSRKVLTDILNEQIDENENLTQENNILIRNQRKLLNLLSNKDTTIDEIKRRLFNDSSIQDVTTLNMSFMHDGLDAKRQRLRQLFKVKLSCSASQVLQKFYENSRVVQLKRRSQQTWASALRSVDKLYYNVMLRSIQSIKKFSQLKDRQLSVLKLVSMVIQSAEQTQTLNAFSQMKQYALSISKRNRVLEHLLKRLKHRRIKQVFNRLTTSGQSKSRPRIPPGQTQVMHATTIKVIAKLLTQKQTEQIQSCWSSLLNHARQVEKQTFSIVMHRAKKQSCFQTLGTALLAINNASNKINAGFAFQRLKTLCYSYRTNQMLKQSNLRRGLSLLNKQHKETLMTAFRYMHYWNRTRKVDTSRLIQVTRWLSFKLMGDAFSTLKYNSKPYQFSISLKGGRTAKNRKSAPKSPYSTSKSQQTHNPVNSSGKSFINIFALPDKNQSPFKLRPIQKPRPSKCRAIKYPKLIIKLNAYKNSAQKQGVQYQTSMRLFMDKMNMVMKSVEENQRKKHEEFQMALRQKEEGEKNNEMDRSERNARQKQVESQCRELTQITDAMKQELKNQMQTNYENEQRIKLLNQDKEKLLLKIDEMTKQKSDLVARLDESFHNLKSLKDKYDIVKDQQNGYDVERAQLIQELDARSQGNDDLLRRISQLEVEREQIHASRSQFSASRSTKIDSGDSVQKLKKQKTDIKKSYDALLEQNARTKKQNTELTREAIELNEEKLALKNEIDRLRSSLREQENRNHQMENKMQAVLKMHDEKINSFNSRSEAAYQNIIEKLQSEKNEAEKESATYKSELKKFRHQLEQVKIKQQEGIANKMSETEALRKREEYFDGELKDLNFTIANLNREKVNQMREMTLIHERALKTEHENSRLKEDIDKFQNEIEGYQNQLELYVKVLKSMDEKIQRLEAKSTHTLREVGESVSAVKNASGNTEDLMEKLTNIRRKFQTTKESS